MWWQRRRDEAEQQLIISLQDQISFLRSELDSRTREMERLHTLLAQKEKTEAPAELPIHTYLSQMIPILILAVGGVSALVSFFTVEDTTVKVTITGLSIAALISLLAMKRLFKQRSAIDEESRRDPAVERRYLRLSAASAGLYMLGVVLFIAVTVIYALN